MAQQRTVFDTFVLVFFLPAVQVLTSDVTVSSINSQCAASNNPSDLSGLLQMRVERSQEDDFIADNEELHGEDFDEDADLSDEDEEAQTMIGNRSEPTSGGAWEAKIGTFGSEKCPPGSVAISSEEDCKKAAQALGRNWRKAGTFYRVPKGCSTNNNRKKRVFYNKHATGAAHRRFAVICTKEAGQAQASSPTPTQAPCGWTTHPFQKCVGEIDGAGCLFCDETQAKKKCLELGPSKCQAVTCRKTQIRFCYPRTCATLDHSGHGEVTYKPKACPVPTPPAPTPTPKRRSDDSKCMDQDCCKMGRPQCKDNYRPMVVGKCPLPPGIPAFVTINKYQCIAPLPGGWLETQNEERGLIQMRALSSQDAEYIKSGKELPGEDLIEENEENSDEASWRLRGDANDVLDDN